MTTQPAFAKELLARPGSGVGPEDVALLFSPDTDWEIAGDTGALPWLGRKKGRAAADFVRDLRKRIERLRFEVDDTLAGKDRAVILGNLASRVKSTGRIIETAFAIILTVSNGQITRLRMLEDSFAVARAARGTPLSS